MGQYNHHLLVPFVPDVPLVPFIMLGVLAYSPSPTQRRKHGVFHSRDCLIITNIIIISENILALLVIHVILEQNQEDNDMTTRQQAQKLLAQLPENKLSQAIKFLTDLLEHEVQQTHRTLPYEDPKDLLEELEALRNELSKYPIEDLEAARETALAEKFGQFM